MPYEVSKAEFAQLVERALSLLPRQFAELLEEVAIEVRDRPTQQQLAENDLEPDELLLGLYVGRPRTERSVLDGPHLPDRGRRMIAPAGKSSNSPLMNRSRFRYAT